VTQQLGIEKAEICGLGFNPNRIFGEISGETICYVATKDRKIVLHFPKVVSLEEIAQVQKLLSRFK